MAKIARPLPKIVLPSIERREVPTRMANPLAGIQPRRVVFPLFEIEQGPMIPLTQIKHHPLAGLDEALKLAAEGPIPVRTELTVCSGDDPNPGIGIVNPEGLTRLTIKKPSRLTQIKAWALDLIKRARDFLRPKRGFLNSGRVTVPKIPLDPTTTRITAAEISERKFDLIDRYKSSNPCGEISLGEPKECVLKPPSDWVPLAFTWDTEGLARPPVFYIDGQRWEPITAYIAH